MVLFAAVVLALVHLEGGPAALYGNVLCTAQLEQTSALAERPRLGPQGHPGLEDDGHVSQVVKPCRPDHPVAALLVDYHVRATRIDGGLEGRGGITGLEAEGGGHNGVGGVVARATGAATTASAASTTASAAA